MAASTNEDPIKHVVLLMFENSSFDRYEWRRPERRIRVESWFAIFLE